MYAPHYPRNLHPLLRGIYVFDYLARLTSLFEKEKIQLLLNKSTIQEKLIMDRNFADAASLRDKIRNAEQEYLWVDEKIIIHLEQNYLLLQLQNGSE